MAMEVTDERQANRDQLVELTELALNLAAARCELAIQAGQIHAEWMRHGEAMDKIGKELEKLGAQEMQVHQQRKQLAKIILDSGLSGMEVQ